MLPDRQRYYDYHTKCEKEGSHHKLIYGSLIDKDDDPKQTELFKIYSLAQYGDPTYGDHFIGFEYGRVNGLYDYMRYCYQGSLQLTQCEVPSEIQRLFEETYPNLTGSCLAIIQNVRNCHYVSANVMHGYWIQYTGDETEEVDWIDEISDLSYGSKLEHKLEIVRADHNMRDTNSVPFEFFIGVRIDQFEEQDEPEILAKQLSKSYSSENSGLPSRKDVLEVLHKVHPDIQITQLPMLCFLQTMCYCCT